MKRLYEFEVEVNKEKIKVFLKKPSNSEVEVAEYVYGQKFSSLLNAGFLSKSMMDKKFGGIYSEKTIKDLGKAVEKLVEAQKTIQFFEGAEDLTEVQKKDLKDAKDTYTNIQANISTVDNNLSAMYGQSADQKAEEYMMKWFVLNCSFFSETITKGGKSTTEDFPVFEGTSFEEKTQSYSKFLDDVEDDDSEDISKKKNIAKESLQMLSRIINLWYHGYGKDQETLAKSYEDFFGNKNIFDKALEEEEEEKLVEPVDESEVETPPQTKTKAKKAG